MRCVCEVPPRVANTLKSIAEASLFTLALSPILFGSRVSLRYRVLHRALCCALLVQQFVGRWPEVLAFLRDVRQRDDWHFEIELAPVRFVLWVCFPHSLSLSYMPVRSLLSWYFPSLRGLQESLSLARDVVAAIIALSGVQRRGLSGFEFVQYQDLQCEHLPFGVARCQALLALPV